MPYPLHFLYYHKYQNHCNSQNIIKNKKNNIFPLFLSVKVLPPDICSIILSAGFREKNKCLKA